LGWVLLIIIRPPQRLKGLVRGSCAAENLENMILIIIPAVCKEKANPFGDPDVCYKYGMAYASLSVAKTQPWMLFEEEKMSNLKKKD
nr:auxin efflux carrier [Tanacetum cinerariifolium]